MGWKTLEERRNCHLNLSVFKCLSGLAPPSMCNYFTLLSDSHKLNTRSRTLGKIRPVKPSLEYGRCSFQYRGGLAWNNLHSAIIYPMPQNTSFNLCSNLILSNLYIVLVQFCLIIAVCVILFHLCLYFVNLISLFCYLRKFGFKCLLIENYLCDF